MAIQRESKAVKKFIEASTRILEIHRIENSVSSAMPDLLGQNRFAATFWLEAKALPKWPARKTTFPLKGAFEKGQQAFGRAWRTFSHKQNGHAYCLLAVEKERIGRDWLLLPFNEGDLEQKTKSELFDVAICVGLDSIIHYLASIGHEI